MCKHTTLLIIDPCFEFHSASYLCMAKHKQINSVGGDVYRELHVIMHIKIPLMESN